MKYYLFDCDGVIVDSEILATRAALRALAPYGYTRSEEEHCRRFSGMMDTEIVALLSAELGVVFPPDFHSRLLADTEHQMRHELAPVAGMPDLLRALPLPLAVVSNSSLAHVERSLRRVGVWDRFEGRAFSSEQVARPKPFPDLYLHALATLGIAAADTLVVEDSPTGVAAAKAAGLYVIGFLGASNVFDGHGEVLRARGADALAADAAALRSLLGLS
ncbi:MAG: HAD family hydrolase [Bacteroidia bacterium]